MEKTLKELLQEEGLSEQDLLEILRSDSVFRLLRYGVKCPYSTGMDSCPEKYYINLYNLVFELRKK